VEGIAVSEEVLNIPLFPLDLVLFPGGNLPLRIFEPRYLAMVSQCMRQGNCFGVVQITEGRDAGDAEFALTGTLARIEDFDQLEDGMLGLSCRGESRFRVSQFERQADRLVVATASCFEDSGDERDPPELDAMTAFLKDLCNREELAEWSKSLRPEWNNSTWLGYRLAELLPLSAESKQQLLEMNSGERLRQLSRVMLENKIIGVA
jgi:Lon protease-like protein